ncbi:hypothetical protein [Enterococcus sp. AZ046]|uniref:hypothetical protein n=1 Tax=Enterococcus sp. AZ046 TaxID=2774685 RepID=UPI003D2C509B
MNKKIIVSCTGLAILLGVGGLFLWTELSSPTESSTSFSTNEPAITSVSSDEKAFVSDDSKALVASLEEQKKLVEQAEAASVTRQEIIRVSEQFIRGFYSISSNETEKQLAELYPLMTETAQQSIAPFYLSPDDDRLITRALLGQETYLLDESSTDTATTLVLAKIDLRIDGNDQYLNNYIVKVHLQSSEDGWLVERIEEAIPTNEVPEVFFEAIGE